MSRKRMLRLAANAIRYGAGPHDRKVLLAQQAWARYGRQPWWALRNRKHQFYKECGL